MKRITGTALLLGAALIASGCASTGGKKESGTIIESADTYETEVEEVNTKTETRKKSSSSGKKSSDNILKSIFNSRFVQFGNGSIFSVKTFGGLKQQSAEYVLFPKLDTAGFGCPYMSGYYYITFDDNNRAAVIRAMEQYFKDFENKKLNRDEKKALKAYGTAVSNIRWGTIKSSSPNYGKAIMKCGYKFVDNSPYFTISCEAVTNQAFLDGNSDIQDSLALTFYFTKSQCRTFMDIMSDESVDKAFYNLELETLGISQDEGSYDETEVYEEAASGEEVEEVSVGDSEEVIDVTEE